MPELPEEQKRLVEFSSRMIAPMKESKRETATDHEKFYKYYVGKHWKTDNAEHPRPVTNFCFSHTRTSVALISDNDPIIMAYPVDKTDVDKANLISRVFVNLWDKNGCRESFSKALIDAHIFGTGFWKVLWDKDKDDVGVYVIPPEYIYVDPMTVDIHSCRKMAQIMPVPVDKAKEIFANAKYKENLDKLVGCSDEGWVLDRKEIADSAGSPSGTTKIADTNGTRVTEYNNDEFFKMSVDSEANTVVEELWYWDTAKREYWVLITAEGMPIDHRRSGKRLPFVPFHNYWDGNRFWGQSEVGNIAPLNRDYNIIKAAILDHIRLVGNTYIITDTNSNIDVEYLSNLEALVVTKTPGSEFRRDAPPPMSTDAFKVLGDIKFEIDTITGLHDVMQGRRPAGLTAGIAIAELQEAAQVPIRDKARRVQAALNLAGKLMWDEIREHYTKSRWIRIVKNTKPEMYELKPEDIAKEYDIYFDIESRFGQTRGQRVEQMLNLYTAQLVDKQAVHEALGLPDRAEILRRMSVRESISAVMSAGLAGQMQTTDQSDITEMMGKMGGAEMAMTGMPSPQKGK